MLTHAERVQASELFFDKKDVSLGLQLYTLGNEIDQNLEDSFEAIAKIGYETIEHWRLEKPAELRAILDRVGLRCTSCMVGVSSPLRPAPEFSLDGDLDKLANALNTLGAKYAVLSSMPIPARFQRGADEAPLAFITRTQRETSEDDWKQYADFLNQKGAALARHGIRIGCHNHTTEFKPLGNTTPLELLIERTDPATVTFELDAGWAAWAGVDPAALLTKHKGRFRLMHLKDFKASATPDKPIGVEVGSGTIDWQRVLSAAHASGVREFFVEQEGPFTKPRIEAAKISHDYLVKVRVVNGHTR